LRFIFIRHLGKKYNDLIQNCKNKFEAVASTVYAATLNTKKMLTKSSPISTQSNLFHSELFSQLDVKDPLIQLANTIIYTLKNVNLDLIIASKTFIRFCLECSEKSRLSCHDPFFIIEFSTLEA
jgi:hypothetical protein